MPFLRSKQMMYFVVAPAPVESFSVVTFALAIRRLLSKVLRMKSEIHDSQSVLLYYFR